MAFCASPQLGPALTSVMDPATYGVWMENTGKIGSPKPLAKCTGSDGIDYLFVKAGGTIAASTQIAVDSSGVATTGGSSGFYTQASPSAGVVIGQFFWAKKAAV